MGRLRRSKSLSGINFTRYVKSFIIFLRHRLFMSEACQCLSGWVYKLLERLLGLYKFKLINWRTVLQLSYSKPVVLLCYLTFLNTIFERTHRIWKCSQISPGSLVKVGGVNLKLGTFWIYACGITDYFFKTNIVWSPLMYRVIPKPSIPSPPLPPSNPGAFDFFEKFWSNSPLCCQFRGSNAPPVRASKRVKSPTL